MKRHIPSQSLSVCLASYQGERFIRAQIDSILPQLGTMDELVVADDGSSDATLAILKEYGPKLRVAYSSRAGGVVQNFERLLDTARGDLIAFCDQDDIWLPGRAHAIKENLENSDLVVLNGRVVDRELNDLGQDVLKFVRFKRGFFANLSSNGYVGCCMAFKREVAAMALPFPRGVEWHDWYVGLLAELFFRVRVDQSHYLMFRRHGSNASSTGMKSKRPLFKKIWARIAMMQAITMVVFRNRFTR